MIDCTECIEYAHRILARGEINADEVNKLAIDRHILKGCEGCKHESDGLIYTSNPPQNKCKKCGEFYR